MTIICGNSDVILQELVAEGIQTDLILTDPPYNLHKDFGNSTDSLPLDAFLEVTKSRIAACTKILKPSGSILWF